MLKEIELFELAVRLSFPASERMLWAACDFCCDDGAIAIGDFYGNIFI
jgi:hypothetical protein